MGLRRQLHRQLLAIVVAASALGLSTWPVQSQTLAGPLRIVVPYPPGGASDRTERVLAEALQTRLGQTVIVENIVGAGGRLVRRQLAGGPADAPVMVLANPALMVGQAAQVPTQVVGYKGSAPLTTDLMGGHVPVAIDTLDTVLPLHEGGKLRILATSGSTRAVPAVPTFQEAGLKLTASGFSVLYARAGAPAAQVQRWSAEVAAAMQQPEVRNKFLAAKSEPVSATRAQTETMLHDFKAQWVPVVQKAGLQFD